MVDNRLTIANARRRLALDKRRAIAAFVAANRHTAVHLTDRAAPGSSKTPLAGLPGPAAGPPPGLASGDAALPESLPAPTASDLEVDRRISGLKLVNYQPSTHAWSAMWTDWRPTELDSDFARIASLGANGVRLTVMPWTTGYPQPTAVMSARLARAVSLAAEHGLRVQLTLFDWWGSFQDLDGSRTWARAILAPLAGDERVAFIELKNEIDPWDDAQMAWARQTLPIVQEASGGIPTTISVSSTAGLDGLARLKAALGNAHLDLFDLHYYEAGNAGLAYSTFAAARRLVAPRRLFIGESGYSTRTPVNGIPSTEPAREAYQSLYLRTIFAAAKRLGLPAPGVWTLNDFGDGAIPAHSATSRSPVEYRYGLFRLDGSPRPAAFAVTDGFAEARDSAFNGGFEDEVAGDETEALPAQWGTFLASAGTLRLDRTRAHSGDASVRLSGTFGDTRGYPSFAVVPPFALVPGQRYGASVWATGENATGQTQLAIAWYGTNNAFLGQSQSGELQIGTTTWHRLDVRGTAPANAAYAKLFLKSGNNSGSAWFDDATFAQVS